MLKIGAWFNLILAVIHIIGLLWASAMFKVTGIVKEMAALAELHRALPYALTILVAFVFFVFGLYGLSASGNFRRLPCTKFMIWSIAVIYLLRGAGELIYDSLQNTNSFTETLYSVIALIIGGIYLKGALALIQKTTATVTPVK